MNKRLTLIAEQIENGKGVIDVGTDHAYLPVFLAQNNYNGKIFASDINADPLNKAIHNAESAGVKEQIDFFLCDGLAQCPRDKVDTIVIAGMGGDMIVKILDEGYWCMSREYKLILQPMTKAEVLRYWLAYNEFEIESELLTEENGSIYQIIVARFGGKTNLCDAELFTGKEELSKDKELWNSFYQLNHKRFERAVKEMKNGVNIPQYRLSLFEEILDQLNRMR